MNEMRNVIPALFINIGEAWPSKYNYLAAVGYEIIFPNLIIINKLEIKLQVPLGMIT